jgi:PBP1b-binding outer membrane lipoprotein LpoB
MKKLVKYATALVLVFFLTGCGGGGGGGSDPDPELTNCVLGTSTIGNCKI